MKVKLRAGFQTAEGPIWTVEKEVDLFPSVGMQITNHGISGTISEIKEPGEDGTPIAVIGDLINPDWTAIDELTENGKTTEVKVDHWKRLQEQGWAHIDPQNNNTKKKK